MRNRILSVTQLILAVLIVPYAILFAAFGLMDASDLIAGHIVNGEKLYGLPAQPGETVPPRS